jgi:hypothetical protein
LPFFIYIIVYQICKRKKLLWNLLNGSENTAIENKHKWTNKLIQEIAPYLLQHAYNPLDWYPWGGEAFNRAVASDKPIFLSIGYSTCHW